MSPCYHHPQALRCACEKVRTSPLPRSGAALGSCLNRALSITRGRTTLGVFFHGGRHDGRSQPRRRWSRCGMGRLRLRVQQAPIASLTGSARWRTGLARPRGTAGPQGSSRCAHRCLCRPPASHASLASHRAASAPHTGRTSQLRVAHAQRAAAVG